MIAQHQQQVHLTQQQPQYQTSPSVANAAPADVVTSVESMLQQSNQSVHSSTPDRIPISADAITTTTVAGQGDAPPADNSSTEPRPAPASAPSTTVPPKSRRSNKSTERIPKLVVMSVQNGTLVDCSMENKQKTITFKFDISDVNPVDVANDLVIHFFLFIARIHSCAVYQCNWMNETLIFCIPFGRFPKIYCRIVKAASLPTWSETLCVS